MDNNLPAGLGARAMTLADIEAGVALINAEAHWLIGRDATNLDEMRAEWDAPSFNMATDTMAVFSPANEMVGLTEFWDWRARHVRCQAYTTVHPDWLGRGIGRFLAGWLARRGELNVPQAPEGARVVLEQHVNSCNPAAYDLLASQGYRHIRDSYQMRIEFGAPPPTPVVPEGIVIRPINGEEDRRAAMYAAYESFRDHWGAIDEPFEQYYTRWKDMVERSPDYDPSLWFVALDGETAAGVSICWPRFEEDDRMGWVGTLGVRRPWRKRGLGLALLQHSFGEFFRRGKLRAGLGVDAASLTGATRLYERAGMSVSRQYHLFELELRPGEDLALQFLAAQAS